MEPMEPAAWFADQVRQSLANNLTVRLDILDGRITPDEELAFYDEVFINELREDAVHSMSAHFSPLLRGEPAPHLCVWGRSGTGKTSCVSYFVRRLVGVGREKGIAMRFERLDVSISRSCFRALSDLACLLSTSPRRPKAVSQEQLMSLIEASLADYPGALILLIDPIENVQRERDIFLDFLLRRLPRSASAKVALVFASESLDWMDGLDPRLRSALQATQVKFEPYSGKNLRRILAVRVEKALKPSAIAPGVIDKIVAVASREHGDAGQAMALLSRSTHLAECAGTSITPDIVDEAATAIEQDGYLVRIRAAPLHVQAALLAIMDAVQEKNSNMMNSAEAYSAYKFFCLHAGRHAVSSRAFSDLLTALDSRALMRCETKSRGRYGRTREIELAVPENVRLKLRSLVQLDFDARRRSWRPVGLEP